MAGYHHHQYVDHPEPNQRRQHHSNNVQSKNDQHNHQHQSSSSQSSHQHHQDSRDEYGLCPGDPSRHRSVVFVKLTDTALRALENFYRTTGGHSSASATADGSNRPSIKLQLQSGQGSITLGDDDADRRFNFTLSTLDDHGGSFECIRHPGRAARTAENLGRMQCKIQVHGSDDSYQKTRVKMAQANEEAKAHSVKVIKTMSDREPKGRQKTSKVIRGRAAQLAVSGPPKSAFSAAASRFSKLSESFTATSEPDRSKTSNWSPPEQGVRRNGTSIVPSGGSRTAISSSNNGDGSRTSTPERRTTTVVPSINVSPPEPRRPPGPVTNGSAGADRSSSSRSVSPPDQRKTVPASMPSFSLSPARPAPDRNGRPQNQLNGFPGSTGSNHSSPRSDSMPSRGRSGQLALPASSSGPVPSPPDRGRSSNLNGHSPSPVAMEHSHSRRSMPTSLTMNGNHHHGSQSGGSACSSTGTPSPPEKRSSSSMSGHLGHRGHGEHYRAHADHRDRSLDRDSDAKRMRLTANGSSASVANGSGGGGERGRDHFSDLMNSWASQRKSPVMPSTGPVSTANSYVPSSNHHRDQPDHHRSAGGGIDSSSSSKGGSNSNHYKQHQRDKDFDSENRDYTLDFGDITDRKTRQAYKKTFGADFSEYRRLYDQLERVSARFNSLGQELTNYQEGTPEYSRVIDKIIKEYDSVKAKNSEYLRTKKRATYLHKKLAHIRQLIVNYDQTHPRATGNKSSN